MSAEPVHYFAPPSRSLTPPEATVVRLDSGPRNEVELNALINSRMKGEQAKRAADNDDAALLATPVALPTVTPVVPAMSLTALAEAQEARRLAEAPPAPPPVPKPLLPPENEAEARSRLAEAIRVRDAARQAVAQVEDAVAKARSIEAEAEARAAAGARTEMHGADDFARKILEWTVTGGERPDLAPDAASLDARREQDLARLHVDASRQAVRALETDLIARRAVAEQAERATMQAAREVVSLMVEGIAIQGAEAQRVYERARMAAHVVYDLGATAGIARTIRARPAMQRIARGGEVAVPFHETRESGPRHEHHAAWSDLLTALQTDPNAALR